MARSGVYPAGAACKLAVFDLDGTVVDTSEDIVSCLSRALVLHSYRAPPIADIVKMIGAGTRKTVELALAQQGRPACEEEILAIERDYVSLYSSAIPGSASLYPGVVDAFDRLLAQGIGLAICTNKITNLACQLLSHLGVRQYFRAVVGRDLVANSKPDPYHLLATIKAAEGERQTTVMIGDGRTDMMAAAGASVPSILVSFGYGACEAARQNADLIISNYRELDRSAIEKVFLPLDLASGPSSIV